MSFKSFKERRDFLKIAGSLGAAGAIPIANVLQNVAHAAAPVGTTEVADDYKAMVCVFLFGGQDHANVIVPYQDNAASGTTEYDCYAQARRGEVGAAQSESGPNLSYTRARLAPTAVNSADTAGMPAGFTTNVYGRRFALHPSYSELAFLYNQPISKLAVIANTGPLISQVNRHQWFTDTYAANGLPVNLYSHDDQQRGWMSGTANDSSPTQGIGGRIAQQVVSLNGASQISVAISTTGINTFMLSSTTNTQPYQIGEGSVGRVKVSGSPAVTSCDTGGSYIANNPSQPYCLRGGPISVNNGYSWNSTLFNAVRARTLSTQNAANVYMNQWGDVMDLSIRTEQAVNAALLANPLNEDTVKAFREYRPSSNPTAAPFNVIDPPSSVEFGGYNNLAAQLLMVATLIRASASLGANPTNPVKRQLFFVGIGGFDTHSNFWNENPELNKRIDRAIDAFWQAMGNVKVRNASGGGTQAGVTGQDRITLFTMTEFGRTLDSNGEGSDHGWGSHHFVLGGAVKGGKIYGANHNVDAATLPNDEAGGNGGKTRYMIADTSAGAMPRNGIPPTWWDSSQGSTQPGGKARMLIPGSTTQYLPLNHSLDRGELLPTMASDAYVATIARWFGVPAAALTGSSGVFPTLLSAHPTFNTSSGVGFMTIA